MYCFLARDCFLSQQFVLAIFAIESNFSDLLSAKALETSLCQMWGSGHYNIGSTIFASKLLFERLRATVCKNRAKSKGFTASLVVISYLSDNLEDKQFYFSLDTFSTDRSLDLGCNLRFKL